VQILDILYNKEYNYGLTIMDYFPTTNITDTVKDKCMDIIIGLIIFTIILVFTS
jgi:hypothetical protein